MKKKNPNWLNGCSVCNVGIASRIDELINSGQAQTVRSAARILEAEAFDINGGVLAISRNAIEKRYKSLKGKSEDWSKKKSNRLIENQLRHTLSHIRTASNKLATLNLQLQDEEITSIDGIEILLGKVDLIQFVKNFLAFTNYLSKEGLLNVPQGEGSALRQIEGGKGSK